MIDHPLRLAGGELGDPLFREADHADAVAVLDMQGHLVARRQSSAVGDQSVQFQLLARRQGVARQHKRDLAEARGHGLGGGIVTRVALGDLPADLRPDLYLVIGQQGRVNVLQHHRLTGTGLQAAGDLNVTDHLPCRWIAVVERQRDRFGDIRRAGVAQHGTEADGLPVTVVEEGQRAHRKVGDARLSGNLAGDAFHVLFIAIHRENETTLAAGGLREDNSVQQIFVRTRPDADRV